MAKMTEQLSGVFSPVQRDYIAAAISEALAPWVERAKSQDAQFTALLAEVRSTLAQIDQQVNARLDASGVDPKGEGKK